MAIPNETTDISVRADDVLRPFSVPALSVRGCAVRLGPVADTIISRHRYPGPIARLIGETLALTALLGSSLKFDGRFVIQTQGDGPVGFLIADYANHGDLRAYCRFDASRLADGTETSALLGKGHMALTIDQGADMQNYQGIVPLEGQTMADAGMAYFRQSEQIPTWIALAAGEAFNGPLADGSSKAAWRAGGLLMQHLPAGGEALQSFGNTGPLPLPGDDDHWREAVALAGTAEDHELLDPMLDNDCLLYRLFHERGVRVFDTQVINERCRCSVARISAMLERFTAEEIASMAVDEAVVVTCEFCGRDYRVEQGPAAAS